VIARAVFHTAQRRRNAAPDLVEDLVQQTFLKLCIDPAGLLGALNLECPDTFYGYVKKVAVNTTRDHFRLSATLMRDDELEDSLDGPDSPEIPSTDGSADAMEQSVLVGEIGAILRELLIGKNKERDWDIFWLHYRQGMTSKGIAHLMADSLSVKGVEDVLRRLTQQLRERLSDA
jgi:RNA polymerase sigma-70 factor (ECF subfamily)